MTNLFGVDISLVDIDLLERVLRVAFVLLVAAACWFLRRADEARAARIVLFLAICGHTTAWFLTVFPLPHVYGANGSMDRENHLGWANVVALGFSPLRTYQAGHIHFEPLWPLLTAIASGFDLDRIGLVFQIAPWLVGLGVILAVRFAWARGMGEAGVGAHSSVAASFAAMGAVLLIAVPQDAWGTFRNPWALTFLLKPNHALGLALTPLALLAIARARDLRTRVFAGLVLQLVGWAFVIHMALVVFGLVVFVTLSWIARRPDRREDLLGSATAVGVNAAVVSPYLVMLAIGYPFLKGNAPYGGSFLSERTLEGMLQPGLLWLLAAAGAASAYRHGSRFGRIAACQWIGAQIVWLGFPLLGYIGQAREQDEAFYWCRFWTGLFAGAGLFELVTRVRDSLADRSGPGSKLIPAGATLLLLLPALLPTFWSPRLMDQYFNAARKPVPDWIAEPTAFIRATTPIDAVFAGNREYARWIAAYGARRVLLANSLNAPKDSGVRSEAEAALLRGRPDAESRAAARRYGISHLLVTSEPLLQAPDISIDVLRQTPGLELVFDRQFDQTRVAIFKVIS